MRGQPSLEKPPLRFLLSEVQGPFVGGPGFRLPKRQESPERDACKTAARVLRS